MGTCFSITGSAVMEFIAQYWQILASILALVIWVVRLESMVKSNTASIVAIGAQINAVNNSVQGEIARLEGQRGEDLRAAEKAREATTNHLIRMDDKLDRSFAEVRNDIKGLIRQGGAA